MAVGSHLLNYYRTDAMELRGFQMNTCATITRSRSFVAQRAAGSSWIRTLHRGAVEGSLPRTVVVGEYHAAGKCAAMDALKLGLPCPSGDRFLCGCGPRRCLV